MANSVKEWTYEAAGVPHLKGDPSYNKKIVQLIRSTHTPGVLGSATGFAALFDFKKAGVKDPLLVSSTDGVGTKLEIARLQNKHDTIGIDLVAMCVNDLITCGAKPLFFLDYYATGKFDPEATAKVLKGIAEGCREAGCALVGGETAVMPGFYQDPLTQGEGRVKSVPQYDLAGFSVGVVDRTKVIDGRKIQIGDQLLGIASSGFHSNGYSLLRKIFSEDDLSGKLGKELLTPTRIYVKPVLAVLKQVRLHGIVNITGGGFIDNLPRVLPSGFSAQIKKGSWPQAKLFQFVQESGNITDFEMARTFNMGIGMVLILKSKDASRTAKLLKKFRLNSWVIGEIVRSSQKVQIV